MVFIACCFIKVAQCSFAHVKGNLRTIFKSADYNEFNGIVTIIVRNV